MLALEAGARNEEGDSRCTSRGIPADSGFLEVIDREGDIVISLEVTGRSTGGAVVGLREQLDTWRTTHTCAVRSDAGPDASVVETNHDGGQRGTLDAGATRGRCLLARARSHDDSAGAPISAHQTRRWLRDAAPAMRRQRTLGACTPAGDEPQGPNLDARRWLQATTAAFRFPALRLSRLFCAAPAAAPAAVDWRDFDIPSLSMAPSERRGRCAYTRANSWSRRMKRRPTPSMTRARARRVCLPCRHGRRRPSRYYAPGSTTNGSRPVMA